MMHTCFWNNEILTPIQKHGMQDSGEVAFKKLRILLDRIMLRRTKIQRADDLGLPPRTVIVRRDYFSPEEKELYLSLFSDAKRQFSTYVDAGTLLNSEFFFLLQMEKGLIHLDNYRLLQYLQSDYANASNGLPSRSRNSQQEQRCHVRRRRRGGHRMPLVQRYCGGRNPGKMPAYI
jgi:SNF2 family DNA or RNA helicase